MDGEPFPPSNAMPPQPQYDSHEIGIRTSSLRPQSIPTSEPDEIRWPRIWEAVKLSDLKEGDRIKVRATLNDDDTEKDERSGVVTQVWFSHCEMKVDDSSGLHPEVEENGNKLIVPAEGWRIDQIVRHCNVDAK
jgi:hypothetical protein